MKKHGMMRFVTVVGSTWADLLIDGMGYCSLEERLELLSRVAPLSKMIKEHLGSVCFVLVITAESIDAEDHSMNDASKQPWWVA